MKKRKKLFGPNSASNFLRLHHICKLTGMPRSVIISLIQNGDFPEPKSVNLNVLCWHRDVVEAHLGDFKDNF